MARILQYVERIRLRHKTELVHLVCRYWSLKREARRGAPLLKRLHLEPWTALSGSRQQTDEEEMHFQNLAHKLLRHSPVSSIHDSAYDLSDLTFVSTFLLLPSTKKQVSSKDYQLVEMGEL